MTENLIFTQIVRFYKKRLSPPFKL